MEKKQVYLTEEQEKALDKKRRDELKKYRDERKQVWYLKR